MLKATKDSFQVASKNKPTLLSSRALIVNSYKEDSRTVIFCLPMFWVYLWFLTLSSFVLYATLFYATLLRLLLLLIYAYRTSKTTLDRSAVTQNWLTLMHIRKELEKGKMYWFYNDLCALKFCFEGTVKTHIKEHVSRFYYRVFSAKSSWKCS